MTDGMFSFLNTGSKWTSGPSIATYLIVIGVLISAYFTARMAYDALNPDSVDGTTSIKGKVEKKGSELPIEGVLVSIEGTEDFAYTDSNGKYSINDTEAGIQVLSFSKPGYQTRRVKYFLTADDEVDLDILKLESVNPFNKPNENAPGAVSGTVSSKIGNGPVAGAEVRINGSSLDFSEGEKRTALDRYAPVSTGADGKFTISQLPVGAVELVVVVGFNETYSADSPIGIKFYCEIVTFYANPGNTTSIDVVVDPSTWAHQKEGLHHPYTFVKRRSVIEKKELTLDLATPASVAGESKEVSVFRSHTGELVDKKGTTTQVINFTLDQGLYDIQVICPDCKVTRYKNISFPVDLSKTIEVPPGLEAKYNDEADTSGYLLCLLPSVILIVLGVLGAYYSFTRKKFFLSILGAIALVPSQSIALGSGSLQCITVNLILGILAALLIFKSRPLFEDVPKPDESMLDAEKEKAAQEKAEDQGRVKDVPLGKKVSKKKK